MRLVDFLLARIQEDEAEAKSLQGETDFGLEACGDRMLAECEAKRAILDRHRAENWNIPTDHKQWEWDYEIHTESDGFAYVTAAHYASWRLNRTITVNQYFAEVGATQVIAPELVALARVYANHPDYQEDWTE